MISNRTEYAIRALWELAKSGDLCKSEDIAVNQNIPPRFLAHILSDLSRAGLVKTARGYGGGITLNHSPKSITLKTIIEAVQGPIVTYGCLTSPDQCEFVKNCSLKGVWRNIQSSIEDIIQSTTLEDIISQNDSRVQRL
ncbi:MAG: Rrf2 family transcriptional regulator [Candidatus Zixiibacteriota bacterium]